MATALKWIELSEDANASPEIIEIYLHTYTMGRNETHLFESNISVLYFSDSFDVDKQ